MHRNLDVLLKFNCEVLIHLGQLKVLLQNALYSNMEIRRYFNN